MADQTATLALRAPVDVVEAIDRYAADLGKRLHGISVTRNDAMRRLLTMGLEQAGFLHGSHYPDGLNLGKEVAVPPDWKPGPGQYRAPPLLHPLPDEEQHPEWHANLKVDE